MFITAEEPELASASELQSSKFQVFRTFETVKVRGRHHELVLGPCAMEGEKEGEASRHKEFADVEVKKSATMVHPRADHKCACVLTKLRTCMTCPRWALCRHVHGDSLACTSGTDCSHAERWSGKQCTPGLENPVP